MFSAILIEKGEAGQSAALTSLDDEQLPDGDVSIDVEFSTLNYKDGLAITGKSPVIRKFPMVPGIDLAGVVTESTHAKWSKGDWVVLNGWGVGETHWGGLAQRARLNGDWLVPLPAAFNCKQAMAIGTAGYTASLCVNALLAHGVRPEHGEVLVTGATGGVGSIAIVLLTAAGFRVAAATGKQSEAAYLQELGAVTVLACGLAQGMDFPATVAPFILRGVSLLGVDSVMAPPERRLAAWERLSRDLDPGRLDAIAQQIPLSEAIVAAGQLMDGQIRGRIVVDVNG